MQVQQPQQGQQPAQPGTGEPGEGGRGARGEGARGGARRGRGGGGRGRGGQQLPQIPEDQRPKTVEEALVALPTAEWGVNVVQLMQPVEDAIVATHGNEAERRALELKITEALKAHDSPVARDYLFRQLSLIGTAASVPAVAAFLANPDLSHKARFALQRIPAPEAGAALRDALAKVPVEQKIGVISSLGARREEASVSVLAGLLDDGNAQIASAAAYALGTIGSVAAAEALGSVSPSDAAALAAAHASLECAEVLLADGKRTEAMAIYQRLSADGQPRMIQLAATRGRLTAAPGRKAR